MNPVQMFKGAVRRVVSGLATHGIERDVATNPALAAFMQRSAALERPRVLELGTRRSHPDVSTRHDEWVPHASEYVGSDIESGIDVDLVADVHRLTSITGVESYDIIVSCSTFEHFKYPHLAAHEIMKALRVGGLLFVQTHQTFPLHAHPYDYFRYSTEAMAGLFGTRMGFEAVKICYEFPSRIHSPNARHLAYGPSFLNVCLFGEKRTPTPDEYGYELDGEGDIGHR
ncbi:MAG: methyltransferase domain-containing protein [Acidimicrobiia bacterium]|nr:methyltransferase domain-containing protein [Acidimicrobiia bacterium]